MIDSHCHLNDSRFANDLQSILLRAAQAGVEKLIIPGVQSGQWQKQQRLKDIYPNIYNAFGIHPWYCDQHNDSHIQQLEALLPHAIAVGECGLDFSPSRPAYDIQQHFFQKQLELAKTFNLPLMIHSVKSADQVATQLRSCSGLCGVIHGFSGSIQQAETFINMGFFIGIGTRLLQNQGQRASTLLHELPLESLLLETDAPDGLGKQQRNEPANLLDVAQKLATIRGISLESVQQQCTKNTKELFLL
ncbi:MAG: TatD family hydrolase [Mariprofundaceae bacterium]|nr:TatD family hydrolase [Mariprofundaceae bacterium]